MTTCFGILHYVIIIRWLHVSVLFITSSLDDYMFRHSSLRHH